MMACGGTKSGGLVRKLRDPDIAFDVGRYRTAYRLHKYESCFDNFCDLLVSQLKQLKETQAPPESEAPGPLLGDGEATYVVSEVSQAALLLWSSNKRWQDTEGKPRSELCAMINKVLRDDTVAPMGG